MRTAVKKLEIETADDLVKVLDKLVTMSGQHYDTIRLNVKHAVLIREDLTDGSSVWDINFYVF